MEKDSFIIWSDDPAEMEDLSEYKERLAEECPELLTESDEKLYFRQVEENREHLEDERVPRPSYYRDSQYWTMEWACGWLQTD